MSGFFGGGGTTPVNMVGASTGTAGTAGYVPAPDAGKNTRYLSSDGTFGELPLLPKYKNTASARYVTMVFDGYIAGASAPTINVRYFALIYVPSDGQVDVLSFRTNTGPTSAINVHLALWQVNEDGTVGSYVIGGTGSSGTTGNTNINISVTATNVVRGYYWISFTCDATPSASGIATVATQSMAFYQRFLGSTSLPGSSQVIWFYTCLTSYSQTTHETFSLGQPSGSGIALPQMAFQYV